MNLEREKPIRVYQPIELSRLTQLYNLQLEIKRWERLLIKTRGKPVVFQITNKEGNPINVNVSEQNLMALYTARNGLREECNELGVKDEAMQMAKEATDYVDKQQKRGASEIPEAFKKL